MEFGSGRIPAPVRVDEHTARMLTARLRLTRSCLTGRVSWQDGEAARQQAVVACRSIGDCGAGVVEENG